MAIAKHGLGRGAGHSTCMQAYRVRAPCLQRPRSPAHDSADVMFTRDSPQQMPSPYIVAPTITISCAQYGAKRGQSRLRTAHMGRPHVSFALRGTGHTEAAAWAAALAAFAVLAALPTASLEASAAASADWEAAAALEAALATPAGTLLSGRYRRRGEPRARHSAQRMKTLRILNGCPVIPVLTQCHAAHQPHVVELMQPQNDMATA